MHSRLWLLLPLVATGFLLASCGSKSTSEGESKNTAAGEAERIQGEIKIDGSSTVYPITEAVAEEFRADQPDVKVTVGVSGTGGGFKKFGRGEIDINDASRPMKEQEAAVCQENNIKHVSLKVAYDGLVVVVNPQNTWATSLTIAELKKLWEPEAQGKITKWNQIRPYK
jgi:phosphate transport system substrate-binding protein